MRTTGVGDGTTHDRPERVAAIHLTRSRAGAHRGRVRFHAEQVMPTFPQQLERGLAAACAMLMNAPPEAGIRVAGAMDAASRGPSVAGVPGGQAIRSFASRS